MPNEQMKTHVFSVLEEPYCVWEHPDDNFNTEFLEGIDPGYFKYIADSAKGTQPLVEEAQRAAIQLRSSYHHALETFFSLVGALVQAPTCVYGWLSQCKTEALRTVIRSISAGSFSSPRALQVTDLTWESLSTAIYSGVRAGETSSAEVITGFNDLWNRLAADFLSQDNIDEYNSLKHGFRARAGGFMMSMGVPDAENPDDPERKIDLGGSAFGSSYLRLERAGGSGKSNRSLLPVRHMVNWSAEQTRLLLELVSYSINNVVSFLKLVNGTPPEEAQFIIPDKDEFQAPWNHSVGLVGMNMRRSLPATAVRTTTKEELQNFIARASMKHSGMP